MCKIFWASPASVQIILLSSKCFGVFSFRLLQLSAHREEMKQEPTKECFDTLNIWQSWFAYLISNFSGFWKMPYIPLSTSTTTQIYRNTFTDINIYIISMGSHSLLIESGVELNYVPSQRLRITQLWIFYIKSSMCVWMECILLWILLDWGHLWIELLEIWSVLCNGFPAGLVKHCVSVSL